MIKIKHELTLHHVFISYLTLIYAASQTEVEEEFMRGNSSL